MARRPARLCIVHGCPGVVVDRDRCADHQPEPWAGTTRLPGGWPTRRRQVLARDGHRCVACGAVATTVDHVRARAFGGTEDLDNLQSLCDPCHQTKTTAEAAAGRRRADS